MQRIKQILELASRADQIGIAVTRVGLIVVLVWIGGLKIYHYEADGIVPFVANSPVMSFFYGSDRSEYRQHMNREGAVVVANRQWHERNHTYPFALGLGAIIVTYGLLISLHPWWPSLAALGSFLVFTMSLVTLSFLITTPECWVPDLGGPEHGFPLLAGPGRLVLKDAIMMGAALVTMADSARLALRRTGQAAIQEGSGRYAEPARLELVVQGED